MGTIRGHVKIETSTTYKYSFAFDGGNTPDLVVTITGRNTAMVEWLGDEGYQSESVDLQRFVGIITQILERKQGGVNDDGVSR